MATIERHVTRDLIVLDSMTPCREAARLMSDRKVGSVAVREGGRVIGLVTERDLVSRFQVDALAAALRASGEWAVSAS